MKNYITVLLLIWVVFSCSEKDETNLNEINSQENFVDAHDAFHNTFYRNNGIATVTQLGNVHKAIYHYNTNGDLFEKEAYTIDDNGNETYSEYNSISYELVYEEMVLKQRLINEGNILINNTHYEYENDLVSKVSDYRDDELYYFCDYEYTSEILTYKQQTILNSAGIRFGTAPATFEYYYYYNDAGNLLRVDSRYQDQELTTGSAYLYENNSNLPYQIGDNKLTYTYFIN